MMRCAARMGWCMRLRVAPFCCPIPLTPAAITLSGSGRARGVAGASSAGVFPVRKLWFDAAASGSEEQLQRLLGLGQDVNDDSSDTCSSGLDGTALHHATLKVNSRHRALACIAPTPDGAL